MSAKTNFGVTIASGHSLSVYGAMNRCTTVDTSHETFSLSGAITVEDEEVELETPMFIAMDSPLHAAQRRKVSAVVAPENLKKLQLAIRQRASEILDSLPTGETFNWVEHVSIELTVRMFATLFDLLFEDRHKLTRRSDVGDGGVDAALSTNRSSARRNCWSVWSTSPIFAMSASINHFGQTWFHCRRMASRYENCNRWSPWAS